MLLKTNGGMFVAFTMLEYRRFELSGKWILTAGILINCYVVVKNYWISIRFFLMLDNLYFDSIVLCILELN